MTSTSGGSAGSKGSAGAKGPDELRQQIETTRHQLGDTVEELLAKTDVKALARAQMAGLKGSASHAAHSLRERAPRAVVIGGVGVGAAAAAVGAANRRRQHAPRVQLLGRGHRGIRGSSCSGGGTMRRGAGCSAGGTGTVLRRSGETSHGGCHRSGGTFHGGCHRSGGISRGGYHCSGERSHGVCRRFAVTSHHACRRSVVRPRGAYRQSAARPHGVFPGYDAAFRPCTAPDGTVNRMAPEAPEAPEAPDGMSGDPSRESRCPATERPPGLVRSAAASDPGAHITCPVCRA